MLGASFHAKNELAWLGESLQHGAQAPSKVLATDLWLRVCKTGCTYRPYRGHCRDCQLRRLPMGPRLHASPSQRFGALLSERRRRNQVPTKIALGEEIGKKKTASRWVLLPRIAPFFLPPKALRRVLPVTSPALLHSQTYTSQLARALSRSQTCASQLCTSLITQPSLHQPTCTSLITQPNLHEPARTRTTCTTPNLQEPTCTSLITQHEPYHAAKLA